MSDIVDLTFSDPEEEQAPQRQAKRQRTAGASSDSLGAFVNTDEDAVVVEEPQQEQQEQPQALDEAEDLRVVGERGEGALPRSLQPALPWVLGWARLARSPECVPAAGIPGLLRHCRSRRSHCQAARRPRALALRLGHPADYAPTSPPPLPLPPAAVWNKNLPHTRDLCGEPFFSIVPTIFNNMHCDKVRRQGCGDAAAAVLHSAGGLPEGCACVPLQGLSLPCPALRLNACSVTAMCVMCWPANVWTGAPGAPLHRPLQRPQRKRLLPGNQGAAPTAGSDRGSRSCKGRHPWHRPQRRLPAGWAGAAPLAAGSGERATPHQHAAARQAAAAAQVQPHSHTRPGS